MSLSAAKVTSVWAYTLAELQPVPQDKLQKLLQVCTAEGAAGKDAGAILQRIMPLTMFLEKAHDKNAHQVVPAVVQLLQQLPGAWLTAQTGPKQVQADWTQVMMDLRKALRSTAVPESAKQQLSRAVQDLIKQLFTAVAQQQSQAPGWDKCGCYLLLRALTRSLQFLQDPGLPVLPTHAVDTLRWVKAHVLGAQGGLQEAAAAAAAARQAGSLPAQDDKPFLLLTRLVLTATGAPAAVVAAAAESDGTGYYAAISAAVSATALKPTSGDSGGGVRWLDAAGMAGPCEADAALAAVGNGCSTGGVPAASAPPAGGGVRDPVLLCELLEWSSTRVQLALQRLFEPTGAANIADAPSREATTASAAMAATCIHILQSGPQLTPDLEEQLKQQIGSLLRVALTVGEAAVASAAEQPGLLQGSDADKALALGARILSSMTPFVAAAAQRISPEELFDLTSRLHQVMLAAAGLAARQRGQLGAPAGAAASAQATAGSVLASQHSSSLQHASELDPGSSLLQEHLHGPSSRGSAQQGGRGSQKEVTAKLAARMQRLAARKEASQKRLERRQLKQQGKRAQQAQQQQQQQQQPTATTPASSSRVHITDLGVQSYAWGSAGSCSRASLDGGLGLGGGVSQQPVLGDSKAAQVADEDRVHPWSWDVTQPLTVLSGGIRLADLPLSTGVGGFLLARASCEMLCEAMAAAWAAGRAAPVRRLMLLPQGGNSARVVTALAMGRLYSKLEADNTLGQLLLPLLADLLTSSSSSKGSRSTLGGAVGGADAAAAAGQVTPAEVAGAVVCALEGMASVCVQRGQDQWLYEQALQLLMTMYREPSQLTLQLLAGKAAPPSTAGVLADTLHLLAAGLEEAPQRTRKDLSLKLLLLFSEVAAGVGGGAGVVRADLGDLLVAVAVAAEGLERTIRLLGGSSSSNNSISRMSMHDIQSAQREGASTTRLFRSLWLYTAMHKLVNPAAGTSAGSARSPAAPGDVQWEWQVAAGRLAAVTPLLMVGTNSHFEADMVERLKIELGEQLSQAGSLGSASSLTTTLVGLLGGKPSLNGQTLPQPTEAVLVGFIVAVAMSELCRAALAPLPDLEEDPVVGCPISVTLGYLKGVLPDGVAAAWVGAIVRQATQLYIKRLLQLAAQQEREEEDEGADVGSSSAPALAYAEQLACVLIANLGDGGSSATEGTQLPTVAALADSLLGSLLKAFPALYHSHACYAALLAQLQEEEGDAPMGQVQPVQAGVGWVRTKAWVETAAAEAPLTTEALLHSFITSSDSLPGATAPAWLRDDRPGSPRMGYLHDNRKAQKAAYRRAADLLQACGAARRRSEGAAAADGAYEGALGLTRKLHYTGYVQGFMNGRSPAAALRQLQQDQGLPGAGTALVVPGTAWATADDDASSTASVDRGTQPLLQNLQELQAAAPGKPANGLAANGAAAVAALGSAVAGSSAAGDACSDESVDGSRTAVVQPSVAAVADEITAQLGRAVHQPGPQESKLATAQLSAAALVAVQPDSFSCSSSGLRILRALARAPLRRLTPETMRLSQFCWCWVSVESPEVLVPLLSGISNAWISTIDRRLGLFSGATPTAAGSAGAAPAAAAAAAAAAAGGHGDGRAGVVDMLAEDHGAEDDPSHEDSMLQAISAHFLWLSFLQEQWAIISRLRDARTAAARVMYGRLLAASLHDPAVLSHHPAAVGAYFRLLTLGLKYGRSCLRGGPATAGKDVLLLFDRIVQAALLWFKSPPRYFARCTRRAAAEQVAALDTFMLELQRTLTSGVGSSGAAGDLTWPSYRTPAAAELGPGVGGVHASASAAPAAAQPHPVWGTPTPDVAKYIRLLQYLCGEELMRLRVWTDPLKHADPSRAVPVVRKSVLSRLCGICGRPTPDGCQQEYTHRPGSQMRWREYVPVAWQVDPALALSLQDHFPANSDIKHALEALVVEHAHAAKVQLLPKAALLLANAPSSERRDRMMRYLPVWAPGTAAEGLELLCGPTGSEAAVRSYAIKCLFNTHPEKLVFFLPQLVQLLRGDRDGAITNFFLAAAADSDLFGHQLIWALNSEARPPEEAFNPEVKRSGWQPPKDTGLWEVADKVSGAIQQQMTPAQQEYWQGENGYFSQVTALSGYLYKFSKDERRVKLQEALAQFAPPRDDLYLPTNPEARVKNHIPSSGACMQSAAKVPILVAFDVEVPAVSNSKPNSECAAPTATAPAKMACIFKVGDDIRQDVLAIQVIKLLHGAFEAAGLNLFLRPYGCLPTGYECGIIEVVPNCKSRAALGELSDRGLHDIFCSEFGAVGSPSLEQAREHFIVSEAAYAVASYLLQAKDRHNGNIMLDDKGHIVHIDFGFILEISPGGNLGFESAAFKLSHEMTQLLDPGGRRSSPQFNLFRELVIRAYLAARTVAEPIIATVSLMAESGLPCFSRGAPVANLRNRFHLEMNDAQAAAFMKSQIDDAYDKWTTGFYDYIQSLQNKIPY